jgi:hypothetical protein
MKQIRISSFIIVLFVALLVFSINADADLYIRGTDTLGNQLIYDSDLDITWYDYTAPGDTANPQKWWADQLSVNYWGTIIDDWRLPNALYNDGSPCDDFDYMCTNSEMTYLYYTELSNPDGGPMINTGPFQNLIEGIYWLETEGLDAYAFDTSDGTLFGMWGRDHDHYGIAVFAGDVGVIPEPISSILFITGGVTLGFRRFRKKSKTV